MSKYFLTRSYDTDKVVISERVEGFEDEYLFNTKAEAKRIKNVINKLESQFKGLQVGLPADSVAYEEYCGGHGHFVIDVEDFDNNLYLNYWERRLGQDLIDDLLKEYGLYFEWENPAVATVMPF